MQKNIAFVWDKQCKEAFATLKEDLASAPILAYPRFDQTSNGFLQRECLAIVYTVKQFRHYLLGK